MRYVTSHDKSVRSGEGGQELYLPDQVALSLKM